AVAAQCMSQSASAGLYPFAGRKTFVDRLSASRPRKSSSPKREDHYSKRVHLARRGDRHRWLRPKQLNNTIDKADQDVSEISAGVEIIESPPSARRNNEINMFRVVCSI